MPTDRPSEPTALSALLNRLSPANDIVRIDVASSTVTYVGKALPGTATSVPLWKIIRLTSTAGGNLILEFAGGTTVYNKIWDNRASLSYS